MGIYFYLQNTLYLSNNTEIIKELLSHSRPYHKVPELWLSKRVKNLLHIQAPQFTDPTNK